MRVRDFISLDVIKEISQPANFLYGQAIYQRGGVEFIEQQPSKIEAWIGGLPGTVAEGGGQRRRTQLIVSRNMLKWHCTGNPKDHQIFCKHCVALALAILSEP
jgi:uncharacterized Zn finger protein